MGTFSSYLTLNSVANYVVRNIDYILIGKFFPPDVLGQYAIAYKLLLFPLKMISSRIYSIMLPVLSRNVSNPVEFKKLYFRMSGAIAFGVLPISSLIAVTAWFWVPRVFPSNYNYLVSMVAILSIVGAVQSLSVPAGSLFLLINDTKRMFINSVVVAVLMIATFGGLCLLQNINLLLVGYMLVSAFVVFPLTIASAFKGYEFRFRDLIKSSQYSVLAALTGAAGSFITAQINLTDFFRFFTGVLVFVATFLTIYYVTSRNDSDHSLPQYWLFVKG